MELVRYGIIGFGRFAERRLAPTFRECRYSRLVALQKRDAQAAREKAAAFGVPRAYGSVEELLADPEIDAVFVASANAFHCEHVLASARSGKHVLVEKPMALTAGQCREMIAACREADVRLAVGQNMRYSQTVLWLKERVDTGALGRILSARATFHVVAEPSLRSWVFDAEVAGGGSFHDLGVHLVDALRFLLGQELQQVRALFRSGSRAGEIEVGASCIAMGDGGTLVHIHTSFELPYRTEIVLHGTRGTAGIENFSAPGARGTAFEVNDGQEKLHRIDNGNTYREEIDRFSLAIIRGRDPDIPGAEGLANQLVLDELQRQWRQAGGWM